MPKSKLLEYKDIFCFSDSRTEKVFRSYEKK